MSSPPAERKVGMHGLLTIAGLGLVAACSTPESAPPPQLRAAARQAQAGEEAYLTGHIDRAIPALIEAAHLYLQIGDLPGEIRALLNLALAQRAAGDATSAAATATRLRDLRPAAQQQAREQGALDESTVTSEWLDALLAFDRGDLATAGGILSGLPAKPGPTPLWSGRVETLRAEVALGGQHFAEALADARLGRADSSAAHDRAEEARALRIAGSAAMGLQQWRDARDDFLGALKIEESLGGGARMIGDLNHLATVAEHLGDPAEARIYSARAQAIASAH